VADHLRRISDESHYRQMLSQGMQSWSPQVNSPAAGAALRVNVAWSRTKRRFRGFGTGVIRSEHQRNSMLADRSQVPSGGPDNHWASSGWGARRTAPSSNHLSYRFAPIAPADRILQAHIVARRPSGSFSPAWAQADKLRPWRCRGRRWQRAASPGTVPHAGDSCAHRAHRDQFAGAPLLGRRSQRFRHPRALTLIANGRS
jgi:hypothetical protein